LNLKLEKLTCPLKADRHIRLEPWTEKAGREMGRKHYLPQVKGRLEDYLITPLIRSLSSRLKFYLSPAYVGLWGSVIRFDHGKF